MKFLFLFLIFSISNLFADVLIEPATLSYDAESREGDAFSTSLNIENQDSRDLNIDFIISAEGWSVEPSSVFIKPGESVILQIYGAVPHDKESVALLMLSDREDVPYIFSIQDELQFGQEGSLQGTSIQASPRFSPFYFFFSPGCAICDEFYDEILPALNGEQGLDLRPERKNIYDSEHYELLEQLSRERNVLLKKFPVIIAGDHVFSGDKGIRSDFPDFVREGMAFSNAQESPSTKGLRWLPVFLAGLLDGINPCAFTSLIFLISYLRLVGKKGKDILKIGGSFTFAVFISYFFIGLGAFRFLQAAESYASISVFIKYILVVFLMVLGSLSVVDYIKVKKGNASGSFLQLSPQRKKDIHRVIRKSSRSAFIYAGSFGAGVLISIYELGCTGQIYLPMLVYMVKQESLKALFPLLLYNFAFITPLLLVFILFYRGSDSQKIADYFQKKLGLIKVLTAVLFFSMSIFLILV